MSIFSYILVAPFTQIVPMTGVASVKALGSPSRTPGSTTIHPSGVTPSKAVGVVTTTPSGATGILSVVVTRDSDSATATYTEVGATDLGDYVDPVGDFTQGCLRAGLDATFTNFYLHFRKDKQGGATRREIVFEYGAIFNGAKQHMTAYHASIRVDGVEKANIAVPYHFHFSRWRAVTTDSGATWNINIPRTIRTTVAAMVAAGQIPPLVTSQTGGVTPTPPTQTYSIMGLAGQAGDMTGTGDHYEIGMTTEFQAYWICTGLKESTMFAQAESSASWPWHYRDENTGAPLNKTTYNQASSDTGNSPNPLLAVDSTLNGTGGMPVIKTDLAHHPSLCGVPFFATGDPYYLEEIQFTAGWTAFTQNWTFRAIDGTSHLLATGGEFLAIRASGWMCRTVAQALKATPSSVPSWLLPKSYWQTYNDQLIAYFTARCITNPPAVYSLFRTIERVFGDNSDTGFTAGTYGQPYMEDYVGCAWNFAAWMHPGTGWDALAEWKRGNAVGRSSTVAPPGWEKAETSPYRYQMRATPTGAFYTSWNASWNGTQAIVNLPYTSGVLDVANQVVVDYGCYIRAVITWGKIYGDATCDDPFTYLNTSLLAAFNGAKFCSYKWAVDPNA